MHFIIQFEKQLSYFFANTIQPLYPTVQLSDFTVRRNPFPERRQAL